MNPEEIKMCNCAGCHCELLGESMESWWHTLSPAQKKKLPRLVKGRILGRPYCTWCLEYRNPLTSASAGKVGARNMATEDDNPWQQNAVREMEDS